MGDSRGRPETEHDRGCAGTVRAQPTGRPHRVAPNLQWDPIQRWLRLQGDDSTAKST